MILKSFEYLPLKERIPRQTSVDYVTRALKQIYTESDQVGQREMQNV